MSTATEQARERIGRIALGDVIHRCARRFGARTALIEGDHSLSYTALNAATNQFAHYLLAQGMRSAERVGMLCNNSIDMIVALLGIQKAGMVWVPINTALAPDAIQYILEHAEVTRLVADASVLARPGIGELVAASRIPVVLLEPAGEVAGLAGLAGLAVTRHADALAGQPATLPDVDIASGQLAQIMYTSGTTGPQKGVMHSHASVHSVLAANLVDTGCGTASEVFTCLLPMFHCAQHGNTMSALLGGHAVVIGRGFDPARVLADLARHRVTVVVALPMMYRAMLEHPQFAATDLSSVRLCIYGMAPLPKNLLLRLLDAFCPNFVLCSGQTEMYPAATIFEAQEQRKRFGAFWGVGTVVNEVAVMSDDGRLLGPGEPGEIVFRGPNVMLGYYKDPEATARVQRFGWHHSGDLGVLDEDGQLLFLDRIKDMIKSGGENVPSIKVEEVLLRHAAVANAAVVGLPHARWGEAVTAFVTLKPGARVEDDELGAHCKAHLGGFEVPKAVLLLAALPATSTGKIQKFALRQRYREHYDERDEEHHEHPGEG
ncbi:class I adenylate-forming enzyme family protein [Cupriavidus basilensis]|uniref:class I adenylate-forming enzyme family protein n=1 Tax=Cupriavidus basilensis TaxID=68895 RepID=UPI00157A54A4|nr:AMP-binding protein [Cupriavidus basilensis]NUA29555.1 AMP-dependent synthetase [Cupriavidus basilensis]